MSKITFQYRSKKKTGNLSIRLNHGKEIDIRVASKIQSKKEYWFRRTTKNGKSKTIHIQKKDISITHDNSSGEHVIFLTEIEQKIIDQFKKDYNLGIPINKKWMEKVVLESTPILETKEKIQEITLFKDEKVDKKKAKKEKIRIANLISTSIKKMFIKYTTNKSELKKYKVTLKVFLEFEEDYKQIFKTVNFNQNFADLFKNWGLLTMRYQKSYINAQLGRIQSAIINSYENDPKGKVKVSRTLRSVKGFTGIYKNKIVTTLNYDELDLIDETLIINKNLQDAKKAILIGSETGLRYSDMNKLVDHNIKEAIIQNEIVRYWKFKTDKINKFVKIVITERIMYLITKYGLPTTNFPQNEVKLNKAIKEVCRRSNINQEVEGYKSVLVKVKGKEVRRNVVAVYPKYKLITTRTLRRSFASNYNGNMDIKVIQTALGHATESQTRVYINEEDETNIGLTKHQSDEFHQKRINDKQQRKENPKMLIVKKIS